VVLQDSENAMPASKNLNLAAFSVGYVFSETRGIEKVAKFFDTLAERTKAFCENPHEKLAGVFFRTMASDASRFSALSQSQSFSNYLKVGSFSKTGDLVQVCATQYMDRFDSSKCSDESLRRFLDLAWSLPVDFVSSSGFEFVRNFIGSLTRKDRKRIEQYIVNKVTPTLEVDNDQVIVRDLIIAEGVLRAAGGVTRNTKQKIQAVISSCLLLGEPSCQKAKLLDGAPLTPVLKTRIDELKAL